MQYNVKIDAFEGPLDLLLHLVHRLEIDINDISVSEITDQYLDFIHEMQELQLDVAAEYLLMAATLLETKSALLLPARDVNWSEDEWEEAEEEDPREALIQRLIAYKKYKYLAGKLSSREGEWQNVYSKPAAVFDASTPKQLEHGSIYELFAALKKLKKRQQLRRPRTTKVYKEGLSVEDKKHKVITAMNQNDAQRFTQLYDEADTEDIVVTFLALLELMKTGVVSCQQNGNFTDFTIFKMSDRNE